MVDFLERRKKRCQTNKNRPDPDFFYVHFLCIQKTINSELAINLFEFVKRSFTAPNIKHRSLPLVLLPLPVVAAQYGSCTDPERPWYSVTKCSPCTSCPASVGGCKTVSMISDVIQRTTFGPSDPHTESERAPRERDCDPIIIGK